MEDKDSICDCDINIRITAGRTKILQQIFGKKKTMFLLSTNLDRLVEL